MEGVRAELMRSNYVAGLTTLLAELDSTDESWRSNPLYSEDQKTVALLGFIAQMLAQEFDQKNDVEVCDLGTVEF